MNVSDPAYAFDHDQMHRAMLAAAGNPSALTPILDPATIEDVATPAGYWQTYHVQAHGDFAAVFPAITWPSTAPIVDINLAQGPTEFWAFSNKNLHDLANTMLATSA